MISDLTSLRYTDPKKYFAENPDEKIVLGTDLDEVCFSYLETIRKRIAERGRIVPEGQASSWSLVESGWVDSREEFLEIHSEAVTKGLYKELELLPGAREMLWDLVKSGYENNIITSRFVVNKQHMLVVHQTAEALDYHDLPYSNLMFQRTKNRFIADAYLDDGPHNIEPLRADGRFVVKINQLYNKDLGAPEADDWWRAREILRDRFGR